MLLTIQQAAIKAPATVTDSLRHSIDVLTAKVDSLEKITERAEIGSGFFSEIISLQLGIFLFVVGLASLVSWGFFGRSLIIHKTKVEKNIDSKLQGSLREITERFDNLENDLRKAIYDVNRAMYFACDEEYDLLNRFDWALASLKAIYMYDKSDKRAIRIWLKSSIAAIQKIKPGEEGISDHSDFYIQSLLKVEDLDDDELIQLHKELKKQVLHAAHSIPQPPENLMEGDPTPPPPAQAT